MYRVFRQLQALLYLGQPQAQPIQGVSLLSHERLEAECGVALLAGSDVIPGPRSAGHRTGRLARVGQLADPRKPAAQ